MTFQLNTRAAIGWTSTGADGDRLHTLAVPLRDVVPAKATATYFAESLDRTSISTVTVGQGVHELVGTVRFDDDPQSLLDLIAAGNSGKTLTYYPDLRDPDVSYPCLLVSPRGTDLGTSLDPGTGEKGWNSTQLRLRPLTAGATTPFHPLFAGTAALFHYRAGAGLHGMTFTRATAATTTDKGPGTARAVSTGIGRLTYLDLDGDGIRETPALLTEIASTNILPYSSAFSASWTADGTPTFTTGQADAAAGTGAVLVGDDDGAGTEDVYQPITDTTDGTKTFSLFIKQGTATVTEMALYDVTAAAFRHHVRATWSGGVPTLSTVAGAGTLFPVERYRGGWFRIMASATGVLFANTTRMYIYPAGATAANTGTTYCYGAQVEELPFPTAWIPTTGATATRNADAFVLPIHTKPQAATFYLRFVERGMNLYGTSTRLLEIVGGTVDVAFYSSAGRYSFFYFDGTTSVTSTAGVGTSYGDVVELHGTLSASGVCTLTQVVNGGTPSVAAASSALPINPSAPWTTAYLSGYTGLEGIAAILNARIERGTVPLADMRIRARA